MNARIFFFIGTGTYLPLYLEGDYKGPSTRLTLKMTRSARTQIKWKMNERLEERQVPHRTQPWTKWPGSKFCESIWDTLKIHRLRRKIWLIKSNAKCCYLKKLTSKGTLRQVFTCLCLLWPHTRYFPPPWTLFTRIQYYSQRGGGGELPERRLEGQ